MKDYSKTKLTSDTKKLTKFICSPMHKQDDFLESETGKGIFEIQMGIRKIIDDKPFHVGISILQHSKV